MEHNKKESLIFELFIDEITEQAVQTISFVEEPAIQVDFMFFNVGREYNFKTTNEEKRIVTGLAMIPNQKIVRQDPTGEPYFVFFSKDTIRRASELYFKHANINKANIEHVKNVDNVTVVESWIVESDVDKTNFLGFKNVPVGSWAVSYKVENDELWDKVKSGEVQGFSIEGFFNHKKTELSIQQKIKNIAFSNISEEQKVLQIKSILGQN